MQQNKKLSFAERERRPVAEVVQLLNLTPLIS